MLLLRAERPGSGDGRFYLVKVTATDIYGNSSTTCLTVLVPKSQSAAHVAAVQAEAAAAQSQCTGAGLFVIGKLSFPSALSPPRGERAGERGGHNTLTS